jgi:hypothetical protein
MWEISPRCATATRADGIAAALASGPEPERHEVMPMTAHAAAITKKNRLCIKNVLLIPSTAYLRDAWE